MTEVTEVPWWEAHLVETAFVPENTLVAFLRELGRSSFEVNSTRRAAFLQAATVIERYQRLP